MTDLEVDQQSIDDYTEFDNWQASVEIRFRKQQLMIVGTGALGVVAIGVGYLAIKGVTNLAKGVGQIAQLTNQLANAGYPPQQPANVAKVRHGVDETVEPPPTDIAEPAQGPVSEVPDRIKALIDEDGDVAPLIKGEIPGVE